VVAIRMKFLPRGGQYLMRAELPDFAGPASARVLAIPDSLREPWRQAHVPIGPAELRVLAEVIPAHFPDGLHGRFEAPIRDGIMAALEVAHRGPAGLRTSYAQLQLSFVWPGEGDDPLPPVARVGMAFVDVGRTCGWLTDAEPGAAADGGGV
jgi:hypothetical protein